MDRLLTIALVLLLVQGMSGCYYDSQEDLYPDSFCNEGDATIAGYYANAVSPIIQSRCATPGCHVVGGNGPGDFTQYANVKAKVDNGRFQQQVFQLREMPPGGLPACDLRKLKAWVDAGASDQ